MTIYLTAQQVLFIHARLIATAEVADWFRIYTGVAD